MDKKLLVEILNSAFDKPSWHGTNLRGSLRGLGISELTWRPQHKRHCIWEVALHTAYWKYVVLRKITNSKKGDFQRKPSNFPLLPQKPTMGDWKNDLRLIEGYHKKFIHIIEEFDEKKINEKIPGSKWKYKEMIYGVAAHDLYHAGQIQLLKRLMEG